MKTVAELIAELRELPGDSPVVLQKDSEGNGYSPLVGAEASFYLANSTWIGECYDPADPDRPVGAVPCVVLYPVN